MANRVAFWVLRRETLRSHGYRSARIRTGQVTEEREGRCVSKSSLRVPNPRIAGVGPIGAMACILADRSGLASNACPLLKTLQPPSRYTRRARARGPVREGGLFFSCERAKETPIEHTFRRRVAVRELRRPKNRLCSSPCRSSYLWCDFLLFDGTTCDPPSGRSSMTNPRPWTRRRRSSAFWKSPLTLHASRSETSTLTSSGT